MVYIDNGATYPRLIWGLSQGISFRVSVYSSNVNPGNHVLSLLIDNEKL